MADEVGAREYHERTKHTPRSVREGAGRLDFDNKPRPDKAYRDRPSRPLAGSLRPARLPTLAAVADREPASTAAGELDLDALTQLCYLSAGITKRIRQGDRELLFRAAACTGALYHIDLYLVVGALEGLPAGVYHFDPPSLSLDVLREGDFRGSLAEATGGDRVAEAPVAVVTTSTWWRNAWKYGDRTYRHAFWDSGTILANLLAVARSLDLPAQIELAFADDPVAELLGVDPAREAPLEVVPVGADDPAPTARPVDPIDPPTIPLSEREHEHPLIVGAHRASSLPDGAAARRWRESAPDGRVGTRPPGDGERVPLRPVGDERASKVPPFEAIRRRGSCRAYARATLNPRKVATVLDRATRGVPLDVGPSTGRGLQFNDIYALINGVDGIEPGVYHVHPTAGELERLRAGECRRAAGHLALDQRLGADAAICLYFMADLDAIVEQLGDRGYRVAQLEAAVTAGRCYLAAAAHRELGSTGLTFYDDAVTEFLSPRAAGQTPMFLWTLGRPA